MKKNIYTESAVDITTGELLTKRWITKQTASKQDFVIMYMQDIAQLNNLTATEFRILCAVNVYLEFNTNEFFLSPKRREELTTATGFKYNTISQCISRLVKKNLLIQISGNNYQMNPLIFFKGEEIARSKYLELTIRYDICPDC